ncbi:hypothetical protein [Coprobacter secundus]|uniref:hypothetical protein n=1 Tax=Coprobacter secundus TaxID=1501392 RepID=UPI00387ED79D
MAEHTQDERIKSACGILQAGSIGAKAQEFVKACQPLTFIIVDGNKSIAYRNLAQSAFCKNKLPPEGFGQQQSYTSEAGTAAYNTAGTRSGET